MLTRSAQPASQPRQQLQQLPRQAGRHVLVARAQQQQAAGGLAPLALWGLRVTVMQIW